MKELVVCHYNEDLAWIETVRGSFDRVTIYSKGGLPGAIPLPNIGREAHTILHHILAGRHADMTVFAQGSPFPHMTPESLIAGDGSDFQFLGEMIVTDKNGMPHMNEFEIPLVALADMLGVSLSETWETGAYSMFRVKGKVLRDALLTPKPYLAMAFAIQHDSGTKTIHETQFHERGAWVIERMWKQILL